MGVTHFFDDFQAHTPARDRMGHIHLIFEVEGEKFVFPMEEEMFKQYHDLGTQVLGQPKVDVAHNMEEAKRAGQQAHVPTRPRR